MHFSLEKIQLDLKVNWKLSRNETLFKENYILKIHIDDKVFLGEVAPNVRYHENQQRIIENFETLNNLYSNGQTIPEILTNDHHFAHSFQFALNSAYTQYLAHLKGQNLWQYFNLDKPKPIATSYSVPIMQEEQLGSYLATLSRFKYIKIKVNQENAISFVKSIAAKTSAPLRIDGNEAWSDFDQYKKFEESVKDCHIQFIEQPFKASMIDDYIQLKKKSHFEIMADESIEQKVDFELIQKQFHSINVKLMKAGGLDHAINLLVTARQYGLKTMLGCMIETSLGISQAIYLSSLADYYDLDGSLLIKNDPFNLIHEKDGYLSLT
jgi:L-Ala-D/L-Glu epimerase